jgi:hypothetical protein
VKPEAGRSRRAKPRGASSSSRPCLSIQFMSARVCPCELRLRRRRSTHFARLRLGLRCVLKTKKRVPRAPRPNARLTNPQVADARSITACCQATWRSRRKASTQRRTRWPRLAPANDTSRTGPACARGQPSTCGEPPALPIAVSTSGGCCPEN